MTDSLKLPPHSIEAEQSVLGGLLLDNDGWDKIADIVAAPHFYSADHRHIFAAIKSLVEAGRPADVITVAESLDKLGQLAEAGGLPYLGTLAQNTPTAANITHYARIVHERALVRKVISTSYEITTKAYEHGNMSSAALVDYAQAKMQSVSEIASRKGSGPQTLSEVMGKVVEKIEELYARDDKSEVTGLATGFHHLDKLTTGLQPGDLVILAARPSMGKTSFALNIAEHVGIALIKPVLVFSMEMINEQLGLRMMSSLSHIHAQRVRTGRIYDPEWEHITTALKMSYDAPIWIDEDASITPTELRTRARRIHRQMEQEGRGGLALIVIDYLQLMRLDSTGRSSDNRAIELGDITRGLKHLAKELHCPVVVLSQLNRSLEARPNKRPIMSDLRDSGSIEQDADIVLFIYRDEVYNEDTPDKGLAEIIVGKQRNGPTGKVIVKFSGELTKFSKADSQTLPSSNIREQKRITRGGSSAQVKGEEHVEF
jgi:replicative DNA helicase